MKIIETGMKVILGIIIPYILLVNLYNYYIYQGGNDFLLGITAEMVANWEDSFFGVSSFVKFFESAFPTYLYTRFIDTLRWFINKLSLGSFDMPSYFVEKVTILNVLRALIAFIKNCFMLPWYLIAGVAKLIIIFILFIENLCIAFGFAVGGYYNQPLPYGNNISPTDWNYISDYVYAM